MTPLQDLHKSFQVTLKDGHFSRGERRTITQSIHTIHWDKAKVSRVRNQLFSLAKQSMTRSNAQKTLEWLKAALKVLPSPKSTKASSQVFFSPGDQCLNALISLIRKARTSLDICVFTITDNRISDEILGAHHRKLKIRIISDNDKAFDLGSDILTLARRGIPTRTDQTANHMHHKFAIIDHNTVATGSYNWTRSAADRNHENILVTDDSAVCKPYLKEFERLWPKMKRKVK
jgi:cardiolipin hydrolase